MTELHRELPEGYKMTEIGPLPREWEVVKLGEVGNVITGNTPSKKNKEYWENGEIDFIKPPDLQNRTITTFSEKLSDKAINKARIVKEGSVLVSCIGNIGRVGFALKPVAFNQQINAIITNNKICNEFLFYVLQAQQKQIENLASFTTVPIVSKAKFVTVKIPLPPLPEQKKIAAVLSTAQKAKEKTEAVISAAQGLKKSMMSYLFTYGPVPLPDAENVPQKETEIGMIPEEWEVVNFSEIGKFQYGYTESGSTIKIGPKFLRITDIDLTSGNINWSSVPYCKISDVDYPKYELYDGDVLVARIGATTGKTCIIKNPPKSVFASYLIRFIHDKGKVDPFFVYYFTNSKKYWAQVNASKEGKLKKGVSSSQLKIFRAPLPPLPTQQKIASMLSAIDEKIEAEENKKKALEDLFNTLLHNLMTDKIRVNKMEVGV